MRDGIGRRSLERVHLIKDALACRLIWRSAKNRTARARHTHRNRSNSFAVGGLTKLLGGLVNERKA